ARQDMEFPVFHGKTQVLPGKEVSVAHVKKLLGELERLDKPEYERACCVSAWHANPAVSAVAAEMTSVVARKGLPQNERQRLANFVQKQSGWRWPKHPWKEQVAFGCGLVSFFSVIGGSVVGVKARECAAQTKDPEASCRTHDASSSCPEECDEDRFIIASYGLYGLAGLTCATCVGLSLTHLRIGYNPALKNLLDERPFVMQKMEVAPCPEPVVRVVLPGQVVESGQDV
ncbi:MAG: hypothetical protein U1E02_07425, partial [Hydrogenophaga sp.]|nr:hypothetical protein [Hydrogenophaga sp.]